MRSRALLLLAISCWSTSGLSQSAPSDLRSRVDRYIRPLLDVSVFSGVVLIADQDSILLERAYGMADVELGVPMRIDNVFRISSISKSFTRALIGRLIDQGLLSLTDPLSRWIPDFTEANNITIQMLVDHRAGVPSVNSLAYDEEGFAPNSLAKLVEALKARPLDYAPGTSRRYSNGGYAVLATVIERATGRRYEDVLRDEILLPLGLTQTRHQGSGDLIDRLAHGVMPAPDVPMRLVAAPFQEMSTKTGGGSLVSSARDLHRWARSVGTSRVLSLASWKQLFPNDTNFVFDGRSPGYMSYVSYDRGLTIIILSNNYATGMIATVATGLAEMARGKKVTPLPLSAPTQAALDGLEGVYGIPDNLMPLPPGTSVEIRRVADHLVAYVLGIPLDVLMPQGERSFLLRNLSLTISFDAPARDGSPSMTVRSLYGNPPFRALRRQR